MDHIKEYKTLGLAFAPGLGGNHIANMISTSPWVQNRNRKAENYKQYLLNLYNKSDGKLYHADEFLNSSVDNFTLAYNLVEQNQLTTVLPDHIENLYWVLDKVRPLGRMAIITIEVFNIDLCNFYKQSNNRLRHIVNYNPYLYRFMYTQNVISRLLDVPIDDVYVINAEKIIQSDISDLLDSLNYYFQLEMDIDLCKKLHAIRHTRAYK